MRIECLIICFRSSEEGRREKRIWKIGFRGNNNFKSKNKRKRITRSYASGLIEDDDFADLIKEIKNDILIYKNEIKELEEIRANEKNLAVRSDNLELFIDVMENLEPEDINDAKKIMRLLLTG